jgi:hypothetical protein
MSAIVRFFRHLGPPQLAVLALGLTACATAVQQDITDDTDGTGNKGGSSSQGGSGGGSATTAGTGGTAGKPQGTTGGAPTAGSGGQASGGAPPVAGSSATAGTTAGGTSGSCPPPYSGTRTEESTIFVGGFGTSTMGTPMWSGYGYTYKYGTATIAPGTGSGCFAGKKFCANGSVPAADTAGAGLGWNISQTLGATVTMKVPVTTPVKITFAGATATMRVQLSASSTVSYCYPLTAADVAAGTATIPFASFRTECWAPTAETSVAYDGVVPIEAIQLAVPGGAAAQTFDICVLDVEPG